MTTKTPFCLTMFIGLNGKRIKYNELSCRLITNYVLSELFIGSESKDSSGLI